MHCDGALCRVEHWLGCMLHPSKRQARLKAREAPGCISAQRRCVCCAPAIHAPTTTLTSTHAYSFASPTLANVLRLMCCHVQTQFKQGAYCEALSLAIKAATASQQGNHSPGIKKAALSLATYCALLISQPSKGMKYAAALVVCDPQVTSKTAFAFGNWMRPAR